MTSILNLFKLTKAFFFHFFSLCVSRAMLFGGMRESSPDCNEIELPETSADAFEALLKYIYFGRLNLLDLKEDTLLDVLGLAHQYGFVELEGAISDYLRAILSIYNVCMIYDVASLYSLHALKETCYQFIDRNATDVMESDSFFTLSEVSREWMGVQEMKSLKKAAFCTKYRVK